jgi:hypothetical protein
VTDGVDENPRGSPPLPHLSRGPRELERTRGDPGGAANALHSCLTRATGEPPLRRVAPDPGARGRGAPSQLTRASGEVNGAAGEPPLAACPRHHEVTRGTGEPKRAPARRRVSKSPAQHAYPGHRATALHWVSRWPWCCARVGGPPALAAPVLLPGAGRPPTHPPTPPGPARARSHPPNPPSSGPYGACSSPPKPSSSGPVRAWSHPLSHLA